MLKIGMIGLGDIATKAYLPVMSRKNLEVHLFSRNETRRRELAASYRFQNSHDNLSSLIGAGINAAFVHASTASHFHIVEELLESNIHVYVDKPVTYDYDSTAKLVSLADRKGLTLMAGFNRRYAPAYLHLKGLKDINMILMQKNRKSLPGDVRTFVFDDFIHVIDTLLFLFPRPLEKITVVGKQIKDLLYHVVIQLNVVDGTTAMGIMNRDSGTVEEKLEVFTPAEKWVVSNVAETMVSKDGHITRHASSDWESTLYKRGFEQITDAFLERVIKNFPPRQLHQEILRTHEICEHVVQELS